MRLRRKMVTTPDLTIQAVVKPYILLAENMLLTILTWMPLIF